MNARIKALKGLTPSEFQRELQPLTYLSNWKATMYRDCFLYYIFPLVEDLLVDEEWLKLVKYFQAFLYLLGGANPDPVPEADIVMAQKLIDHWVYGFTKLTNGAGSKPVIHWLLHVPNDVRHAKCHFDCYSAFQFENFAGKIKNEITSGTFVMEQLVYRSLERAKCVINRDGLGDPVFHADGSLSIGWFDDAQGMFGMEPKTFVSLQGKHRELKFKDFLVSTNFKDSFVVIEGEGRVKEIIFRVTDICYSKPPAKKELCVVGHVFRVVRDLYKEPFRSSLFRVYVFSEPFSQASVYSASRILGKLVVSPRFASLSDEVREKVLSRDEMLGHNYSKVTEWVGVFERHLLARSRGSLY